MKQISFRQLTLQKGSFWAERYETTAHVTTPAIWDRFFETNRVYAVMRAFPEGVDTTTHKFWDSDIAKWMETAAYLLANPELDSDTRAYLTEKMEYLISGLEKNQLPDGYLNCHFDAETRLKNRDDHELYCAGHYIEAAVAYYEATGKDRFLKMMCRYADFIDRVFRTEKSAPFLTPGHEELELALIKLYYATGEKRYLDLCGHFLNLRGNNPVDKPVKEWASIYYSQDYAPVREQTFAAGHAVRATYLYTAMARYGRITGDEGLITACENLYRDITERKMYITGGIGSAREGESFTIPYDLPNETAYSETCAAIALMLFAQEMWLAKPEAKYQDTIERALFNNVLSGISLSGDRFFYINPLRLDKNLRDRYVAVCDNFPKRPLRERPTVFKCSCCPPNLSRTFARIGDFAFAKEGDTYYLNQFIASDMEDGDTRISLETDYPFGDTLKLSVKNVKCLKVRIPGWLVNREALYRSADSGNGYTSSAECKEEEGYLCFTNPPEKFTVTLAMQPALCYADPRVTENTGKAAVTRGPLVYCAEEKDEKDVLQAVIGRESISKATTAWDAELSALTVNVEASFGENGAFAGEKRTLKLIPYYCFANRGDSDMTVWLPVR